MHSHNFAPQVALFCFLLLVPARCSSRGDWTFPWATSPVVVAVPILTVYRREWCQLGASGRDVLRVERRTALQRRAFTAKHRGLDSELQADDTVRPQREAVNGRRGRVFARESCAEDCITFPIELCNSLATVHVFSGFATSRSVTTRQT